MNMFQRIKTAIFTPRAEKEAETINHLKMMDAYISPFTPFCGDPYDTELIRTAVDSFARHASKIKPEIQGSAMTPTLRRALLTRPNPFQTTSQFLYRLATIYLLKNTAIIIPVYDELYGIAGYNTVAPDNLGAVENKHGDLVLVFAIGKNKYALPYEDCGVMTRHQYLSPYFGTSNNALDSTMGVLHAQQEALKNGLESSGNVRFIATVGQALKEKTLEAFRKEFVETNLGSNNNGIMFLDAKISDLREVQSKQEWIDDKQVQLIKNSVYNYYGTSEKIVSNSYNEVEYNAFYEGFIEPWAIQLGEVLTSMTFTENEISYGNSIMFSANRLQYASNATKLQVSSALLDRGVLNRNEVREIWQLPPVDGGDDFRMRGEYKAEAEIDSDGKIKEVNKGGSEEIEPETISPDDADV